MCILMHKNQQDREIQGTKREKNEIETLNNTFAHSGKLIDIV